MYCNLTLLAKYSRTQVPCVLVAQIIISIRIVMEKINNNKYYKYLKSHVLLKLSGKIKNGNNELHLK